MTKFLLNRGLLIHGTDFLSAVMTTEVVLILSFHGGGFLLGMEKL